MPLDVGSIRAQRPQNQVHYFATIGSTMSEAARLVQSGASHGTIVLADEQTTGMGRLGRSWHSEAEAGLYSSILLRLPLPPSDLPLATLLLGLATAEAIEKATDLACDLRWPNDVLIRERKVAGILAQLTGDYVIAGIGINVNNAELPGNLRTPSTSLRLESSGLIHSREAIVVCLLESLDAFSSVLANEGPPSILRAFTEASSYVINRRVVVEETGKKGTTAGLNENGFLLVRYDSGQLDRIAAGGVRPDV